MKLNLLIIVIITVLKLAHGGQYIKNGGTTYYISHPQVHDWYQSFRYCAAMGMFLIDIRTEAENDRLLQVIETYNTNNNITENPPSYWTSGTDLGSEGNFYWMTTGHSIVFQNWKHGNPDNVKNENGEVENCIVLASNWEYGWNDGICAWKLPFICRDTFDAAHFKREGCFELGST